MDTVLDTRKDAVLCRFPVIFALRNVYPAAACYLPASLTVTPPIATTAKDPAFVSVLLILFKFL